MDRKALLKKILKHLDEAMYLMETAEAKPDDQDAVLDAVWFAVNEAHSITEEQFNKILYAEIRKEQ